MVGIQFRRKTGQGPIRQLAQCIGRRRRSGRSRALQSQFVASFRRRRPAAGAAHSNRNSPQASGAEGAAAGAAVSNRNNPKASGAEGAAAGAAASNRNNPKYSGAQGAAAGAAASNRNNLNTRAHKVPPPALPQPIATSLNFRRPGGAAGAAAANRNQPQYSGAEGAARRSRRQQRLTSIFGHAGAAAGYASVRNNVDHPGMYSQQWYGEHQAAFAPVGWNLNAPWVAPNWGSVATQL